METQILELIELVRQVAANVDQTTSDTVEDKKQINQLRIDFNNLTMEIRQLKEHLPMNMDRSTAYAAKEGVIEGLKELVKPKPKMNRLSMFYKKLREGVKK